MRKSSPLLVSPVMMTGLTVVIATILLASNFTLINAQSQQFTSQAGVIENITAPTMFQSMDDSIRVQVPSGWIIQDIDNAGPAQLEEGRQGYGMLIQLCPEEQATAATLPTTTTTNTVSSVNASRCLGAQEVIHIIRYPDLDRGLPANNGLTTATIDNALTYHMQKLQDVGYRNMRIVNSTDTAINIINPQTNQTIQTVPARVIEMTYGTAFAPNELKRGYFLLTTTNATAPYLGTTKGYSIFYEGNPIGAEVTATSAASGLLLPTPLPTAVKQVVDSFELIAAPQATQSVVQTGQAVQEDCDPSYPDVCIASPPPDLNCDDEGVPENFEVSGSDPHGFDVDNDGVGCDSQVDSEEDDDDEADEEEGDDNVGARDDGDEEEEDDDEADEEDDNGGDNSCDPSYPDVCIASPPPDLNCDDEGVPENFEVSGSDPHGFDVDNDGVGCDSQVDSEEDDDDEADEEEGDDNVGARDDGDEEEEDDDEADEEDDNGGDNSCDPSYPDVCIASPPPDLNCDDEGVPENFEVSGSDPHGFDVDNDGVGCESGSNSPVDNLNEDDGDNEGEVEGGESDNGVSGEPQPEPESEPGLGEGGGVEGGVSGEPQPEPGEGEGGGGGGGEGNEGGNNPNEFADCVVPEGMDPGDVGC